jgi:hypothetical protein
MTILYVPEYYIDHEGGDWLGVFETRERALKAFGCAIKPNGNRLDCSHDEHRIVAWNTETQTGEIEDISEDEILKTIKAVAEEG